MLPWMSTDDSVTKWIGFRCHGCEKGDADKTASRGTEAQGDDDAAKGIASLADRGLRF